MTEGIKSPAILYMLGIMSSSPCEAMNVVAAAPAARAPWRAPAAPVHLPHIHHLAEGILAPLRHPNVGQQHPWGPVGGGWAVRGAHAACARAICILQVQPPSRPAAKLPRYSLFPASRPSVRPSVCPSDNSLFFPSCPSVRPSVQLTLSFLLAVRPSVRPSVRPPVQGSISNHPPPGPHKPPHRRAQCCQALPTRRAGEDARRR